MSVQVEKLENNMAKLTIEVECGAQTNTVEEVQNAMPLLADLLYLVLSGN